MRAITVRVRGFQPGCTQHLMSKSWFPRFRLWSVLRGVSGDTPSLISSSAEFDSRLRKFFSGDGVAGLHGCLKHSKSWFNSRSLDHSGQLEKLWADGSRLSGKFLHWKTGFKSPLETTREFRERQLAQVCISRWGMGQSVGQQPLKLFIVSVRVRLPLPTGS